MQKNKHRIHAFTIMELTVAMLISAIVIGITYTAYEIMSKAYLDFTKKNEDMGEMLRVDELLKKDFDKSEEITYTDRSVIFKDSSQTIKYQFEPDFIVRSSTITDTFKIKNEQLQMMFEHALIDSTNNQDMVVLPNIDELSLNLVFRGDTIPYHYRKNYSSQNLIKATSHAGN